MTGIPFPPGANEDTPVFVISVAAELAGLHAQTLRGYDRMGLVSPGRTSGGGRRYSMRDIALLREVQRLSQEQGVNLAGIKRIIDLENPPRRADPGARGRPRRGRAGRGRHPPLVPQRAGPGPPADRAGRLEAQEALTAGPGLGRQLSRR
jgi:DNA-binding transcriptional MerR regulator